jgi:hypothetical protein
MIKKVNKADYWGTICPKLMAKNFSEYETLLCFAQLTRFK